MLMNAFLFFSRYLKKPAAVFSSSPDSCLSQRLFRYNGLVSQTSPGVFILWPMFLRVLNKLSARVERKMESLGAQRLLLPVLGDERIWVKSGRWNDTGQLFKLRDHKERNYCLQPTHEEEMTSLVSSLELTHKDLPLLLYQISTKFRDELRPRNGLIRCREFIMKDLYSFDRCSDSAMQTYDSVCDAYSELLSELGLPFHKVIACPGPIGGQFSHEFHIPSNVGEDILRVCTKCGYGYNSELEDGAEKLKSTMPECLHEFHTIRGVEVGHCFLLGQRYSRCFDATFQSPQGKKRFEMGCYGLGLTRLIAVAVEHLSTAAFSDLPTEQIKEIRWPTGLAPFTGCLALQKANAHDALNDDQLVPILTRISDGIPDSRFPSDILVDDRPNLSLGRKIVDIKRLGIPWIAVIKSSSDIDGPYELMDVHQGCSYSANLHQILAAFSDPCHFQSASLNLWHAGGHHVLR